MTNKYYEVYSRTQENSEAIDKTPAGCPRRLRDKIQVRELCFMDTEVGNDKQHEIDRQIQLAIHLKREEEQLEGLKEKLRQELLEQQKQRAELQQEKRDIERAMQASLEDEKRKLEMVRAENLVEIKWQSELREIKERQQQEVDLQIANNYS